MKDVEIYTTPTCSYCKMVKEFLNDNNVEYKEHDVASDTEKREEMVEKSGQMGVPVVVIGDEMMVGYDEAKLKETLGL